MSTRVIDFYTVPTGAFRHGSRAESLCRIYTDTRLEVEHDYIQWLFPLPEPSRFHPGAPILTAADIQVFHNSKDLKRIMRRALNRMWKFYKYNTHWLTPKNHNFMRITRILRSCTLCGLEKEAKDFLTWLQSLTIDVGVSMDYWKKAVQ